MTDLTTLARAVENGEATIHAKDGPRSELISHFKGGELVNLLTAIDGSIDAAKKLHDAVLPGWQFGVSEFPKEEIFSGGMFQAYVSRPDFNDGYAHAEATTPAAAWVAAILKARANASPVCPVCNGNDDDKPCAYTTEKPKGCLRAERLKSQNPAETHNQSDKT